jgi:hypothetical protein
MTIIIYKTITGRWAWTSVKTGRSSNGSWASKAYAVKVAKRHGFIIQEIQD